MGVANALEALYRHFKLLLLTLSPSHEFELESDRAGRAAELRVSSLFEGIPGVQVYQCLRIPNGQKGRREIDIVLVTERELFVIEVKNWSGIIELKADGVWSQVRRNGTIQNHPDVVEATKHRANLLKFYIEKRGVTLPPSFVQPKVFLVNPDCRPEQAILMQPEVLSADQCEHFLEQSLGMSSGSGWMKSLLTARKSESALSDSARKQLHYILSSAPTWDRLELEGGKIVVGDFQDFQGPPEDLVALKFVKRSAVSHLTMVHCRGWVRNIIGSVIGRTPNVQITVTERDYRDSNPGKPPRKQQSELPSQVCVRPDSRVLFQPVGSPVPQLYNLNNILALSLSA